MGSLTWLVRFGTRVLSPSTGSSRRSTVPVAETLEGRQLFAVTSTVDVFKFIAVPGGPKSDPNQGAFVLDTANAGQSGVVVVDVSRAKNPLSGKFLPIDIEGPPTKPPDDTVVSFDMPDVSVRVKVKVGNTTKLVVVPIKDKLEFMQTYTVRGGAPVDQDVQPGPTFHFIGISIAPPNSADEKNPLFFHLNQVYTISARVLVGDEMGPRSQLKFKLVDGVSVNKPAVTGLTLVNADTDKDIGSLTTTGGRQNRNLNIRAEVNNSTTAVNFKLERRNANGTFTKILDRNESSKPLALLGNNGGDYFAVSKKEGVSLKAGTYRLTVTPAGGDLRTIMFTIV